MRFEGPAVTLSGLYFCAPTLPNFMNPNSKAQLFDVKHEKARFPLSENLDSRKFLSRDIPVNKLSRIKALEKSVRKVPDSCDTINPRLTHPQRCQ